MQSILNAPFQNRFQLEKVYVSDIIVMYAAKKWKNKLYSVFD